MERRGHGREGVQGGSRRGERNEDRWREGQARGGQSGGPEGKVRHRGGELQVMLGAAGGPLARLGTPLAPSILPIKTKKTIYQMNYPIRDTGPSSFSIMRLYWRFLGPFFFMSCYLIFLRVLSSSTGFCT